MYNQYLEGFRICFIKVVIFISNFILWNDTNILSLSISFPIFENPYPMDIHESPVTCTAYFADCPPDLILVLYSIGVKHKKQGYSNKVKATIRKIFSCIHIHMIILFFFLWKVRKWLELNYFQVISLYIKKDNFWKPNYLNTT